MQSVFVGDTVKVVKLDRQGPGDRSPFIGKAGLVVQKLNVAWTPDLGSLWRIRFHDGAEEVFADSEVAVVGDKGEVAAPDMDDLKQSWGQAPRTVSMPFKRRLGANTSSAPALLAVFVFALAGILLIWAGVSESSTPLTIGGAVLILVGLGAAVALVG